MDKIIKAASYIVLFTVGLGVASQFAGGAVSTVALFALTAVAWVYRSTLTQGIKRVWEGGR